MKCEAYVGTLGMDGREKGKEEDGRKGRAGGGGKGSERFGKVTEIRDTGKKIDFTEGLLHCLKGRRPQPIVVCTML